MNRTTPSSSLTPLRASEPTLYSTDNTPTDPGKPLRDVTARILVVDDDERARLTVAALLRGPGNEVAFASSGVEALIKAREWRPDVILLDVMMPGIDGFEVCRRLRVDPEIADVRVFLLTSLDDSASRLSGFDAGADDFMTKPLNRMETLARIRGVARINRYRALIEQHKRLRALEHSYAAPAERPTLTGEEVSIAFERALHSMRLVFHPIMYLEHSGARPVPFAHEMLLRTADPALPSPVAMIAAAALLQRLKEFGREIRRKVNEMAALLHPEQLLFVNMNPAELLDDALYDERDALRGEAPRVIFELTEREPLEEIQQIRDRLAPLREAGYRFALDDLGGGYSSLNSFAVIEPEFVKLDRLLVRGVHEDPIKRKIVHAIAQLCRELGAVLIVEGVETREESEVLLSLGCHLQQGYLFGRPSERPTPLP